MNARSQRRRDAVPVLADVLQRDLCKVWSQVTVDLAAGSKIVSEAARRGADVHLILHGSVDDARKEQAVDARPGDFFGGIYL